MKKRKVHLQKSIKLLFDSLSITPGLVNDSKLGLSRTYGRCKVSVLQSRLVSPYFLLHTPYRLP